MGTTLRITLGVIAPVHHSTRRSWPRASNTCLRPRVTARQGMRLQAYRANHSIDLLLHHRVDAISSQTGVLGRSRGLSLVRTFWPNPCINAFLIPLGGRTLGGRVGAGTGAAVCHTGYRNRSWPLACSGSSAKFRQKLGLPTLLLKLSVLPVFDVRLRVASAVVHGLVRLAIEAGVVHGRQRHAGASSRSRKFAALFSPRGETS